MYLGAVVLLPRRLRRAPRGALPAGHQPRPLPAHLRRLPRGAARSRTCACEYSERFQLDCYNRIEQEQAHQLYQDWTAPGFPRFLVIEIQHANPYYDDSYAVNSQNLGPYGDAIQYELIPYIEKTFRGLGQGWARFMYGGSTGGWEALAVAGVLPGRVQRLLGGLPRPDRLPRLRDRRTSTRTRTPSGPKGPLAACRGPATATALGHVSRDARGDEPRASWCSARRAARAGSGTSGRRSTRRSGPTATRSAIWDKRTGVIDREVAAYWRENYDLRHILKRDWAKGLGQKLAGQDPHLLRRHGQLLPQQRGVPGRGRS